MKVEILVRKNQATNHSRVFAVTLTDEERKMSDYMLKKELIKWVMSAPKVYRRLDPLRVKRLYNKPHLEMNFINQEKYLFVLYGNPFLK